MDIATKIIKTKADLENLESHLITLNARLKVEHPHHCIECGGQGGKEHHDIGGRWEPPHSEWEECPHCFQQGLHPLDTTKSMTEDEVESWGSVWAEDMHPILKEIISTEMNIEHAQEYLSYLEVKEAEEALSLAHEEWAKEGSRST